MARIRSLRSSYWVRVFRHAWQHHPGAVEGHRSRLVASLLVPALLATLVRLYLRPDAVNDNLAVIVLAITASLGFNVLVFGWNTLRAPALMERERERESAQAMQVLHDTVMPEVRAWAALTTVAVLSSQMRDATALLWRIDEAQRIQIDMAALRVDVDRWDGECLSAVRLLGVAEEVSFYSRRMDVPAVGSLTWQQELDHFIRIKDGRLRMIHQPAMARVRDQSSSSPAISSQVQM